MTKTIIWTSIWCQGNPGRGAYAFQYGDDGGEGRTQGAFGRSHTTTNRLQLMAVLGALHNLERNGRIKAGDEVLVHSSSRYLTDGIGKAVLRSERGEVNADLWGRIAAAAGRYRIRPEWVKTRSARELLELQAMARQVSTDEELPPDTGYRGRRPD